MKSRSLKTKFFTTIVVVYILIGTTTYLAFQLVTEKVVRVLGANFAVRQALLEKARLMSAIQRDLSLSIKMAESPLLRRWALDEDNVELKKLAFEELESYRANFVGKSLFFIIDRSRRYYYSDGREPRFLDTPRYTLNPDNIKDAWYFRTMRQVDSFELNVDYGYHLGLTNVWFNVIVKDALNNKIGMCGSGIDITNFIDKIVNSEEEGVNTILIGRDGVIEGHRNKDYVIHNARVSPGEKKITVFDLIHDVADRDILKKAIDTLSSGAKEAETFYLSVEGKRYLAAISHLKEIRWYNLVLVDSAHVLGSRDFWPILAAVIVSLLTVVIIIGLLLNRLILSPLSGLVESSKRIARGDYDIHIPVQTKDEIGELTNSFNDMARTVKDYTENLEKKVRERTEALEQSNQMLASANQRIMDSIHYAQLIQASILPGEEIIYKHVKDFFTLFRPRDIVGGDFYYFRECGPNYIIAVIDCTGHGVPGAFMTMTTNAILDHVLDTSCNDDPAAVIKQLNRLMRAALHHDTLTASIDNGLDIGLCWCSPGQGRLVFAGARMDLYCLSDGVLDIIAGDKQAIGYRDSDQDFAYKNHTVRPEQMMFFLFSDGLLDQSGGPHGWGFGRKRLNVLLQSLHDLPAAEQKIRLERALAEYQGDAPQRDDITFIGFRL